METRGTNPHLKEGSRAAAIISPELTSSAFADFCFASVTLHLFCYNFLG